MKNFINVLTTTLVVLAARCAPIIVRRSTEKAPGGSAKARSTGN